MKRYGRRGLKMTAGQLGDEGFATDFEFLNKILRVGRNKVQISFLSRNRQISIKYHDDIIQIFIK